ncbi:MAG: long-chain fatty acid--CoA ligase [Psychromonas sp.]|nr:long-chain fatty acid--CoA ligase [Psychromonas sp.]
MITEESTLPEIVQQYCHSFRTSGAFFYRRGDGFEPLSSEFFLETVRRFALGLRAIGLKRGDVVAVIASSSPWWLMVDLAIMLAGGRSTAFFPKISEKNLLYQLKDSDSRFAYIDSPELWELLKTNRLQLKRVILRDIAHQHSSQIINFNDLLKKGDQLSLRTPALHNQLYTEIKADDIATLSYTSGSTGYPKGVQLTHRNLCSQIAAAIERYPLDYSKDRALSTLPLAHCFERTVVYTYCCQGVPVYFSDDIRKLKEYMLEVRPTVMSMVPRILEKIFTKLQDKVGRSSGLIKILGKWGIAVAFDDNSDPVSRGAADLLFFNKIREAMGGKLNAVLVGGAALDKSLCRFFINAGIPVYQGYGLTETSPVLTANYPQHNTPGTVGPVFPGVQVQIRGPQREIRCKGPNIMKGYHKLAELTAQRFDSEGWFCTGDCGEFDSQGNLKITGRLTEMFKTSTGKFVSPLPIEQRLTEHPLINAAMLVADGKSFVSALLFAESEALQQALAAYQNTAGCASSQDANYCIMETLQSHIDSVNENLNDWEKIRVFRYITEELSIESGLLTPTMKVCRSKVSEHYHSLINAMYGDEVDVTENLSEKEKI